MIIPCHEKIILRKKILISEKNLSDINFEISRNNTIAGSNNITLRKVNVHMNVIKPYACGKMYMDKYLIEDKMYQLIDQISERKINQRDSYFALLDNIHLFYDGYGKNCKILFVGNFY